MQKIFLFAILHYVPCLLLAQQDTINFSRPQWAFSSSAYYYFVPNDNNLFTAVGYADHKALHFETRFNYEDQNTASVFAGWRFETGKQFQLGVTPLMGIALGNTNGIVPALELETSYKIFDFYTESEYLVDLAGKENDFFYSWSELAASPFDFLRAGASIQRMRLYRTKLDVHAGMFAEYSLWKLTAGAYYFNPFSKSDFVIASLSIDF